MSLQLGQNAGQLSQGLSSIAIGQNAGQFQQESSAIAFGQNAGQYSQGVYGIAIGKNAGQTEQMDSSISIGQNAGQFSQGGFGIAVGQNAGQNQQQSVAIALGQNAGQNNQGSFSVAIGYKAGQTSQGQNAISIGFEAGQLNQPSNSIVLNASSGSLNPSTEGLFIQPIRSTSFFQPLVYQPSTGEIGVYSSSIADKSTVINLPDGSSKSLYNLQPRQYVNVDGTLDVGLLAEEITDPNLVSVDASGNPVSVKWLSIITELVAEVQSLQQQLLGQKTVPQIVQIPVFLAKQYQIKPMNTLKFI